MLETLDMEVGMRVNRKTVGDYLQCGSSKRWGRGNSNSLVFSLLSINDFNSDPQRKVLLWPLKESSAGVINVCNFSLSPVTLTGQRGK